MEIIRCGECGSRLDAGYCPMCMKRIPLTAREKEKPWRQRTYTQQEEDHKCITFDTPAEKPRPKAKRRKPLKPTAIIAIAAAVFSLFTAIGDFIEDTASDSVDLEPEINYSAYLEAGQPGAEEMPRLEKRVLYQQDGLTVTAQSIGLYYADTAICVTVQNDTKQDVTLSSNLLCVNGYMLSTSGLFAQVEAGDGYQTYLYLYADELAEAGIEAVAEVTFGLDIYDSEEYTNVGKMAPTRLTTEAEASQPYIPEGKVLYDQQGVRILLCNTEVGEYGDCDMMLYLENNTDDLVTVYDTGVYLNDQESFGSLWSALLPQTRAVEHIYLYELEELDITDLTDLQEVFIDLHIEYSDGQDLVDWKLLETVDTTITFNPN